MNVILILRIFLTAAGVLFLLGDINAYVRQKLTDTIGLLWAFVSVALILTGVVSVPGAREEEYLVVLLLAVCLLLLILLFKLSKVVSVLSMKNQELAMQVSLLNQENERILHRLQKTDGRKRLPPCDGKVQDFGYASDVPEDL